MALSNGGARCMTQVFSSFNFDFLFEINNFRGASAVSSGHDPLPGSQVGGKI